MIKEPGKVRGSSRPGFTLVELIVVLTIIAILGATIVPQFAGTHDEVLLRAAGRELVAALGLSYSLAVSRQAPCRLVLETSGGRWRIEAPAEAAEGGESGPSRPGSGEFEPVRDVPGTLGRIDRRIAVEVRSPRDEDRSRRRPEDSDAPPEAILFRPDGTAEPREIVLRDREGFGIAIRVDPVTARVRAVAVEREEPR